MIYEYADKHRHRVDFPPSRQTSAWHRRRTPWATFAMVLATTGPVGAQPCPPTWTPESFGLRGGIGGIVNAATVFDDGTGPTLYVGGRFSSAGEVPVANIARWDGAQWSAVGAGLNNVVSALAVFDDGTGPALYAGGRFSMAGGTPAKCIARWDGTTWSPLGDGVDGEVFAMTVFDPPGAEGPALYVGGTFAVAGSTSVNRIAKWDGTQWSVLSGGVAGGSDPGVYAITTFDDGGGPALFVGGSFSSAGAANGNGLARWDGVQWTMPTGIGPIRALAVFDDGNGSALHAGGEFDGTFGHIARWNGVQWSALDSGTDGWVWALTVFDDGSGAALYAGGWFEKAGGATTGQIARWDGSAWSALDDGVDGGYVAALAVFDPGGPDGPGLYAGGQFITASSQGMARWDGEEWFSLNGGLSYPSVFALTTFGPTGIQDQAALYAGGVFTSGDVIPFVSIAGRMEGQWSAVDTKMDEAILALTVFDDGTGPALYAGGGFGTAGLLAANHIARWDGIQWSPVGSGLIPVVYALATYDDGTGPGLYAGGYSGFDEWNIAKWDGAQWTQVGGGIDGPVYTLVVFDDGTGPALYAGGLFTEAGSVPTNSIAKWDGSQWSTLAGGMGEGPDSSVAALTVFEDGDGPALYAGGGFTTAGGAPANGIARWDGTQWSALGSGIGGAIVPAVTTLAAYNDGSGPALYVGGDFTLAGGVSVRHIARWDGTQWAAVGGGTNGIVRTLTVFSTVGGQALYAGGDFTTAGGLESPYVARWGLPSVQADLDCDRDVDGFDFLTFSNCYNGPDRTILPDCETSAADLDGDVDVDGFDFLTFADCYNGSDKSPICQ